MYTYYKKIKINVWPAMRAFFQLLRRASAVGRGFFDHQAKKVFLHCFGSFWLIYLQGKKKNT